MIKTKELDNPALLGTAKISTLLAHYSFPAIVTMITASLYNIVDSIFIGHGVGPMALSGLAVSFPLMNVSAAFGSMVGVGAAALMSIKLGQKDMASAEKILGNMVILNVFVGVLVMAIGLIWLKPILILFGAGEENLPYAYDYMLVIILGNIFTHLYYGMNNALRTTGYPRAVMTVTIITIITNCILDALFIFVFKMGVFGAALATVIAQVVGLSISTSILRRPDAFVRLKRGIFSYKPRIAKEILTIGLPSFLLNLCACLAAIFLNNALKNISGDLSVGAYGIVNRISLLFGMIVLGITQGMQPILGYNYGARKYDRLRSVLRLGIIISSAVMTVGFAVCVGMPRTMAMLFTSDEVLLNVAAEGLRLSSLAFPLIGVGMVASTFFQSIGKPVQAIITSLSRQLLILIPLLIILPPILGTKGVWLAMPISDTIAFVIAIILMGRQLKILEKQVI